MVYRLNLAQLIVKNYPYVLPQQANAIAKALGYSNVEVLPSDTVFDKSKITGHPIFMPLNFGGIRYENDQGAAVNKSGLYLPIAVVVPSFRRKLKETPVAGSKKRGEVTELINPGWYEFSVTGAFVSADNTYPGTDVEAFDGYLKATVPIPVTHKLFTYLSVTQIVIRAASLPSKPGFQNMQLFEFTAKEDVPIELKISNPNNLS